MPAAGIGYVGMAEVAYQRGDLDTAHQQVTEGIPLCRQLNWTQPLAAGLVTLAWIRQAGGDPGGALEAMREAERIALSPSVTSLLNPVPVQRARLLLARGDFAAAARWAQERGLRIDDEPIYHKEREHLVLARVLLAQDQPAAPLVPRRGIATVPGLVEPLTPRELEVLRLLAAGKTNQRIARELVLTLDTVKKHVSHVLAKLGAANRTEAVSRGRELDLIP